MFSTQRKSFASELLESVSNERLKLWHERVEKTNWEIFDRGTEAFTWYAIEELIKAAKAQSLVSGAQRASETEKFAAEAVSAQLGEPAHKASFEPFHAIREELEKPFRDRALFWPRQSGPKGDLMTDEMRERV